MSVTAYPRRFSQPSVEPITLADALVHLRADADSGANDAYVTTLIAVARQACEERIERTLIQSAWTLTLDSFPEAIQLARPPIIAVQSIQYLDAAGTQQTLNPADYLLDNVSQPGFVVPAYGKAWPETRDQINAVVVSYTAGYGAAPADVPSPIRQWLLLAIGDMYANRNASSDKPSVKRAFADSLLDPFKVWGS
jgi:uncharacterized phiE125 gp8 family phage protein